MKGRSAPLVHCNGRFGSTEFEDAGIKPAATSPLQWARSRGLYARAVRYRIYRYSALVLLVPFRVLASVVLASVVLASVVLFPFRATLSVKVFTFELRPLNFVDRVFPLAEFTQPSNLELSQPRR